MLITTRFPNRELGVSLLSRRGFAHTVWFAAIVSVITFGLTAGILYIVSIGLIELGEFRPTILQPTLTGLLLAIGVFLGIVSHIIADVVVVGSTKPAPKPLWPVYRSPITIALFEYDDKLVNSTAIKFAIPIVTILLLLKIGFDPIYIYD